MTGLQLGALFVRAAVYRLFTGLQLAPAIQPHSSAHQRRGAALRAPTAGASTDIRSALADAQTCTLGTPTAEALFGVQDAGVLQSDERSSYVVLITDGKSTCEAPGPAAKALLTGMPSVRVFVIGFGDACDSLKTKQVTEASLVYTCSFEPR